MKLTKVRRLYFHTLAALSLAVAVPAATAQSVDLEYKLKAVFLLNFAKFVSWPATAFANETAPLTLCVVGDDPFDGVLDEVVRGETVQKHPLAVQRPGADRSLQQCHIAFFSRSVEGQSGAILAKHVTPNTLTAADNDNFIQQGGMINFVLEDTKVRFVINNKALSKAAFTVSSKLLSLGRPAVE